jgi:hypothetical protein
VAEVVTDLVVLVEQKRHESQANAASSTASFMAASFMAASFMDVISHTKDLSARKRKLVTVIQQPTLIQAWERCGTRIFTPDLAASHVMTPEKFGGQ